MKRLGFSPRSGTVNARSDCRPEPSPGEPILEGPRLGDVAFEIGVVLAVHLAFACAVVVTLGAFGIV